MSRVFYMYHHKRSVLCALISDFIGGEMEIIKLINQDRIPYTHLKVKRFI